MYETLKNLILVENYEKKNILNLDEHISILKYVGSP